MTLHDLPRRDPSVGTSVAGETLTTESELSPEDERKLMRNLIAVEESKAALWRAASVIALLSVLPAAIVMIAIARAVWDWAR